MSFVILNRLGVSFAFVLFLITSSNYGQSPTTGTNGLGVQSPKPPPDERKALLGEVAEAYKAPHEVDKDVLDELRKQYRNPTPDRETKIFREIRRLYQTTPEQEKVILQEMRRAYENQTAQQEERLFHEIRRNGTLPLGTIPVDVQTGQAKKLFARFDQNKNNVLEPDEMPDADYPLTTGRKAGRCVAVPSC